MYCLKEWHELTSGCKGVVGYGEPFEFEPIEKHKANKKWQLVSYDMIRDIPEEIFNLNKLVRTNLCEAKKKNA